MADGLISGVVKELINILMHQAQDLKRAFGVEKEIANLSSKLENISEVLDDAEKRSFKEKGIKLWMENIKDFCYQLDDVLDEWRTRTLRQQIESPEASCSFFLPSPSKVKRFVMHGDIAKKIKKLDSTLDRITKEKDQFRFDYASTCAASHSEQELMRVTTAFDVDASQIQGRKSDARTLISKLLENSGEEEARNGPLVISIVGTGGIGKTTLAQLVFEDEQIKTHFGDERVWICVSDPFDQIKIAKAIVESITESSTDLSQLHLLLQKIQRTLSGKRFLLVMDDVWTEQSAKWEPLKNSLKDGLPGSRILVTSRKERVAKMMGSVYLHQLDLISDSEAWLLFSRIAFSGRREEDCEKLKDIGQKIAQKCKGLPLAVKVMGSLLCFKDTRDDWQNVLDNKIWELEEVVTELFPHLYLSYNDLTPKMKQCFSYCAVFPKDYVIRVDELIRIWMAQGYVTMESKGRELFGGLAMRSFFQDLKKDDMDSNIIISCKMHDIVHDFVQFLTRNECYSIDQHEDKVGFKNLRHLQSWQDTGRNMNLPSICDIGKLRSFFVEDIEKLNQLQGELSIFFLCDLNNTADVEEAEKAELRNKKHIKELCLHFSEGVDVGIDVMEALKPPLELQTLKLAGYEGTHFPSWITQSLDNLRILKIWRCKNCSSLPPLGKLPSLETLSIWRMNELRYVGSEFLGVAEVGGVAFPKLKKLDFYRCEEWEEWEDFKEEATIIIMPCIRELILEDCRKLKTVPHHLLSRLESLGTSVGIDALKPPLELQTLKLNGYQGSHFPSWITLYLNLRILEIKRFVNCSSLPPLGKLPSLETLTIFYMKELRYVGSEFLGVAEVGGVAFPKLKTLHFYQCNEWEEWEDFKEEATIIIMPCIRELLLADCWKLKTVPHHRRLQESLLIEGCPCLKVE